MIKLAAIALIFTACATDFAPAPDAGTSTIESDICALDEDGNWVGNDCGSQPGGGGGGGPFPTNHCPAISCDPQLGWLSNLLCVSNCTATAAFCQPLYTCSPLQMDDPNCHAGYCANWY